jgi:hypothetical protein
METMTMRFYTKSHRFYCGIGLHARSMHLCILDAAVFDGNLAARPETFLKAIAPFRAYLLVGVECMFAWYLLADRCTREKIPFVLGHALYMKLIYGACPVHQAPAAADRAFAAHLGRGVWHCFPFGALGNPLDLWARLTQQAIYPAVLELYRRLGRTPQLRRPSPDPREDDS